MAHSAQSPETASSDVNETDFAIHQWALRNLHTATIVQVEAVYPETPGSASGDKRGFVDVKLALEQEDNEGKVIKTKTIYGLPYSRIQGGYCAFVVDPKKGDWGWAVFCERDISKWKRSKTRAAPESWRMFDQADGVYLGGILNEPPRIYVQLHEELGIVIESDDRNMRVHVGGDAQVHVEGNATMQVDGDWQGRVKGDYTLKVDGTYNVQATGDMYVSGSTVRQNDPGKPDIDTAEITRQSNGCSGGASCANGSSCHGGSKCSGYKPPKKDDEEEEKKNASRS